MEPGEQPDQPAQNRPRVPEDHADVVAAAAEHGEEGVALGSFQRTSREAAVVLQNASDAVLYSSEAGGILKLNIALNTDSAETAQKLEKIFYGLTAMVSMRRDIPREAKEILDKVKIRLKGNSITLGLESPPKEFIKLLMGMEKFNMNLDF